jgi:hypothetical protein
LKKSNRAIQEMISRTKQSRKSLELIDVRSLDATKAFQQPATLRT